MKKLIALGIIILYSLTASSQTVTNDSTHMRMPVWMMRSIAQDLVKKDSVEQENKMLLNNMGIKNEQLSFKDILINQKDSLIDVKNSLITSKDTIISLKDEQLTKVTQLNKELERQIKKNNNKLKISTASGTLVIIALTILHIIK